MDKYSFSEEPWVVMFDSKDESSILIASVWDDGDLGIEVLYDDDRAGRAVWLKPTLEEWEALRDMIQQNIDNYQENEDV